MDKASKKKKLAKLKYSQFRGNKAEGQGFTEQRKQKAIHQYKKLQRKEQKVKGADRQGQGVAPKKSLPHRKPHSRPVQGTAAVKKGGAGRGQGGGAGRQVAKQHPSKPSDGNEMKKRSRYWKQEQQFQKEKASAEQQRREAEQTRKERHAALEKYSQKKRAKYKVLAKRNFRGQPKLSAQMELLVKQIEASQQPQS